MDFGKPEISVTQFLLKILMRKKYFYTFEKQINIMCKTYELINL